MSAGKNPKEARRETVHEKTCLNKLDGVSFSEVNKDIQVETIQKPRGSTQVPVIKLQEADTTQKTVKVTRPQDAAVPMDYTGPGGPRFDSHGMVLPHSILGRLEDFKREMEARGEFELARRVPDSQAAHPLVLPSNNDELMPGTLCPTVDHKAHALQHWQHRMVQRRRQLDFLSNQLHKPFPALLMNQSDGFRVIQEQREEIIRQLPAVHPGQGYRVGSEFWKLQERLGDELSGLLSTLTQTEKGNLAPLVHVGQPRTIRKETGNMVSDGTPLNLQNWEQNLYLQQCRQELKEVLKDVDFSKPEIDELEVIGTGRPLTFLSGESFYLHEQDGHREDKEKGGRAEENKGTLGYCDDTMPDALLIPALRVCGQLARWTGTSSSHQDVLGLMTQLIFEITVGEQASSYLFLKNEGSTAVYYSWQILPLQHSFPGQHSFSQSFYFNTSDGVILPGETKKILFIFKSTVPGIIREMWSLNTHPVLLGGAFLQVSLWGVALYQDRSAEDRAALELELFHNEAVTVCTRIINDLLLNLMTAERPSSPGELTEEELFILINPQLHYKHWTVEELKQLWQKIKGQPGSECEGEPLETEVWDLSMSTLREAVLNMPDSGKEEALHQFNYLTQELLVRPHWPAMKISVDHMRAELWREMLDSMVSESMWHRKMLGLPEVDMKQGETPVPDLEETVITDENMETKGGVMDESGSVEALTSPIQPPSMKSPDMMKPSTDNITEGEKLQSPIEQVDPELQEKYRRQLYCQVYALLEHLVDSVCELLDDLQDPSKDGLVCVS